MKIKLKRMTSLMLAVIMVCGMMPMPSFATDAEPVLKPASVIYDANGLVNANADKDARLSDGQVILTKEAEATGEPNQYEITLTVRGKGAQTTTPGADIVVVMDKSGSMGSSGMRALKAAAEAFIDSVLADGKTNRVSLVQYSTNAASATKFYTASERATAKQQIPTKEGGGTNTQMGLYKARLKLEESTASQKFVVLISDGEPTFNAVPVINAKWSGSISKYKGYYGSCRGYDTFTWYFPEGRNERWSNRGLSTRMTDVVGYNYDMIDGNGGSSAYTGHALGVLASDETRTLVYTAGKLNLNSASAAIYEADLIKDSGAEIYTVAYITSDSSHSAEATLRSIANTNTREKTYTYTTNSDLTSVFQSIGDSIEASISGGVTDPMGSFIDIGTATKVTGEVKNKGNFKVSNGNIRFEGNTFTWAPNVGEEESTLSYIVELDVEAEGFEQNRIYDTNGITTMEYSIGDTEKTGQFNVPQVKGTYSSVYRIGYRVNDNGEYIDADGIVTDKENAVIFPMEAVGNPDAGNRNQWKPGRNANVAAFECGDEYQLVSDETVSVTTDGAAEYVAEFNYKVKQYDYTVKYYVDGEYQKWDEGGKAPLKAVISQYKDKCPTGYKLEKTENLPLTIKNGENVINVYYVKGEYSYTVNYYMDSKENIPFKTEGDEAQFGSKIPYDVANNIPVGYRADADVENADGTVTEDPANNVVNIIYTKRNDLSYVVNYLEQGTNTVLAGQKKVYNRTFGEEITENAIDITGYDKVAPVSKTITIAVEGNVITFWYNKRTDLSYTVNYYEEGTTNKVAPSKIVDGQTFGAEVAEEAIEVMGYNMVAPTSASIIIKESDNVINFYYSKRNDLAYTVKYLEVESKKVLHPEKTIAGQTFGAEVTENAVAITGYDLQSEAAQTITIQVSGNEIIFWYVKKGDLSYIVNYYEKGTEINVAPSKTVNGQTFDAEVTENAIDVDGYVKEAPTSETITIKESGNVINFYYSKRNDLAYEVNYLEQGTNAVLAEKKTVNGQTFGDKVTETAIDITGYDKIAPVSETITIKVEGNVITFWYTKRTDLSYTVNYYEEGTTTKVAPSKTVDGQTFGAEVAENAVEVPGYNKVAPTSASIIIKESGNVINFYYSKRNDLAYEVNYLEQGSNAVLAPQKNVNGQTFGEEITENAIDITGYDKVAPVSETITIKVEGNVINFYYTKKTNLTYVVNYLEQGTNVVLAAQRTVGNQTFGEEVTEIAIDVTGYDKVAPTSASIIIKESDNVINFYYNKRTDLAYTVRYLEVESENVLHEEKTVTGQTYKSVVTEEAVAIEGYTVSGETSYTVTLDEDNKVITFWYNKRNDLGYTVKYLEVGTEKQLHNEKTEGGKLLGEVITENAIDITGYNKVEPTTESITITAGENEIIFWYEKATFGYTVKYYYDGVCDESKTEKGSALYEDVISEYADKATEGYVFQKKENMPLTVTANADENVAHIYYVKGDYGYVIEYYYDGIYDEEADETEYAKFGSIIETYPDKIKEGYKFENTEGFPMTVTAGTNLAKVYYVRDSYDYIVNYYKDSVDEANLLDSAEGSAQLYGTQLDDSIVTADLGEGWLNALLPAGYLEAGSIEGEYPVIDIEDNIINVVYRRSNALQFTVNYYVDSVAPENLVGSDVTENVTLGDMVYPDTYPVPMMEIALYTFNVFKYLPAGYEQQADIENAPLTVGADVSQNVINVIYKSREMGSLTINKSVANMENEQAGTEFHFKVESEKLEEALYVSAVIEENEGVKFIAPVVIEGLEWGRYTVSEVIYNDGEYIEELTRFDYTVSGEGDVHVGGENVNANISIINTRREGGSLVISKVANGAFDPETVYEFVLYLSHMRYNEVTEENIAEAQSALEALTLSLEEAKAARDMAQAEYDAVMAGVTAAEEALALAKAPVEMAAEELAKAEEEAAAALILLEEIKAQLDTAVNAQPPAEVEVVEAPSEEEAVAEPTEPVAPVAPAEPVAPAVPSTPGEPTPVGEFTKTEPTAPSQPSVEEAADEETVAKALADYETAYAAYETALAAFEAEKTAHDALVAQYNADAAAYEGAKEAYDAEMTVYNADYAKYEEDLNAYNTSEEVAAYNTAKAEYDTAMVAYNEAKAAYDAYMAKVAAYEAYVAAKAKYEEDLAAFNALKASIEGLEAQKAEAEAILAEKNTAVTEKQTALEDVTEAQATPIEEAEKALEDAKALANENGAGEAKAALENAEKAVLDAENAKAEAEEALRHLKSANDPTMRSADEVILVENEALTPIVENDVVIGYTFFLKSGESLILTDLPADAVYEVIEVDNGGADATFIDGMLTNEASGLVDMEEGTVITFTNVFEPDKTITVTKSYDGRVYNGTVAIDIYLVTEDGDILVDTVYIEGSGSETIIVEELGEYKAVERPLKNYDPSYGENAILTEDNINGTLTVVNTYDPPYSPPAHKDNYYKVTVIYVNEETGEEIHSRYTTGSMIEGSDYDVSDKTTVDIEGFDRTGTDGEVSGILNSNVTITVYYAPFVEVPEEEVPLDPPSEEEEVDILEEEIPLIDLPKTGGVSDIGFCMIGLAAIAAGTLLKRKEDEE